MVLMLFLVSMLAIFLFYYVSMIVFEHLCARSATRDEQKSSVGEFDVRVFVCVLGMVLEHISIVFKCF